MAKSRRFNESFITANADNIFLAEGEIAHYFSEDWSTLLGFKIGKQGVAWNALDLHLVINQAEYNKITNLPTNTTLDIDNVKAGGIDPGVIEENSLSIPVKTKLNSVGSGGAGKNIIVTADLTIDANNYTQYTGNTLQFQNTADATLTLGADLPTTFNIGLLHESSVYVFIAMASGVTMVDNVNILMDNGVALLYVKSSNNLGYRGDLELNTAPTGTADISGQTAGGDVYVGYPLTATLSYADAEGDLPGTHLYQWYQGSGNDPTLFGAIAGATTNTYTPVAGDATFNIACKITPVAQTGIKIGTPVYSNVLGPVTTQTLFAYSQKIQAVFCKSDQGIPTDPLVYPGNIWNNALAFTPDPDDILLANALNSDNAATGISIKIGATGFDGGTNWNTASGSDPVVDIEPDFINPGGGKYITRRTYYAGINATTQAQNTGVIVIYNLDDTHQYNFKISATTQSVGAVTSVTVKNTNGLSLTAQYNAERNTSEIARFNNVVSVSGIIIVEVKGVGGSYGHIGNMIMEDYAPV